MNDIVKIKKLSCIELIFDKPMKDERVEIFTAQPHPQPNSTSTRVGIDKVISWTTTTTPKLLRHFQTT